MYNGEKVSWRQQHHEKPERPIGEVTLTQTEIERLRKDFAWSYKCDDKLINYHFGKIYEENGSCNLEFANLIFTMKTTNAIYAPIEGIVKTVRKPIGTEVKDKEIYRLKIILPPEVREKLIKSMNNSGRAAPTAQKEDDTGIFAFN